MAIVSTGGTIASTTSADGSGVRVGLSLAQLTENLAVDASVELGPLVELARVNSWDVEPHLMWRLAREVAALTDRPDVDGVVVTHGTDTLEETAFAVDVLTDTAKPVVFTGAMRSADAPGSDGPENLQAALRCAATEELAGWGVLVCLGNQVHAARSVRKVHSTGGRAFCDPGFRRVAELTPGGADVSGDQSLARWTATWSSDPDRIRAEDVPVVKAYTGMSGQTLRTLIETTRARGLVIEGFGLGHVPADVAAEVKLLVAEGIPVVVATRVIAGGTSAVYGGPGGGTDLAGAGVLSAGSLSAAKARLVLLACLDGRSAKAAEASFRAATQAYNFEGGTAHEATS